MSRVVMLVLVVMACACAATTADNTRAAGDYEAAQIACVDHATTKAQADECRCAVKAQWGRSCKDGGAP